MNPKRFWFTTLLLLFFIRTNSPYQLAGALRIDQTDKHEYTDNYYCMHFAFDLVANLTAQGWRAGYAEVKMSSGLGHAFVWVETDSGLMYVEPQSDAFYNPPVEGGRLCTIDGCLDGNILYYEGE